MNMDARSRIIVPIDTTDEAKAIALFHQLQGHVAVFKIGYAMGCSLGWERAEKLVSDAGAKAFIDAKLHDIPNTVADGVRALSNNAPQFLTIHASAGAKALESAAHHCHPDTTLLAVTVLTSLSDDETQSIYGATSTERVISLAQLAYASGLRGFVCSPQELTAIREALGESAVDCTFVTPGVRPAWAAANDQTRIMTPSDALRAGATALVIGRPITQPPSGTPAEAVERILEELQS